MKVKKGQQLELEVSDIAFGGKGLARVDGLAVFIDQAVPKDVVSIRITRKKKNFAEARVLELIQPSPFRITPLCRYSGFCGGCKWQFLEYSKQLEYKRQHVVESLEHIGQIKDVPVHECIPSKSIFGYRNKMEFSCSDRRWLMPDEMGRDNMDTGFALGLHVPGTFYKVLNTDSCLLHPELGNAILNDVGEYMKHSKAPAYGLRSHIGFWRFLMLRHSSAYDQWLVNLITSSENREIVQPLSDQLISKYPQIKTVVNNITARKAGIAAGEYEILLAGDSCLRDKIGQYDFEVSANSFFQTNTRGAETLYETAKLYAELSGSETLFDLYCGTGTIAIFLSDSAKEVVGIELIASAVEDARQNCLANEISNCEFICGDIMESLPNIQTKADVIIIDPPRTGMHKKVVRQVLDLAPERIVYVSCNPATMARDLGMMNEWYAVREVQPVDMFPHTYHIEAVAKVEKRK